MLPACASSARWLAACAPRAVPGELRIGGFGGVDGLAAFLRDNAIGAVIDATHPFAVRMGLQRGGGLRARAAFGLLRLARPAWQPVAGDRWEAVDSWDEAVAALRGRRDACSSPSAARSSRPFSGLDGLWFLIRTIEPPDPLTPFPQPRSCWRAGRFGSRTSWRCCAGTASTRSSARTAAVPATEAKLVAARQLGLRVVMLRRPERPDVPTVTSVEAAVAWLKRLFDGRVRQGCRLRRVLAVPARRIDPGAAVASARSCAWSTSRRSPPCACRPDRGARRPASSRSPILAGRPTSRPSTTGVSGRRWRRRISSASANCRGRACEAGL